MVHIHRCTKNIRTYNIEKKNVLEKINNSLIKQ